ncbi:hypothetical protein FRC04_006040 [Tulasnella sp. 424]|nr:hypothetical protein FRC04_006040 [Tulasnella sp. 424]
MSIPTTPYLSLRPATISFRGLPHSSVAERSITIKNKEPEEILLLKLTAIPGRGFEYQVAPDLGYLKPNEELVVTVTRGCLTTGDFESEWQDVLGVEAIQPPPQDLEDQSPNTDLKSQWSTAFKTGKPIASCLVPIEHGDVELPEIAVFAPDSLESIQAASSFSEFEEPGTWSRFHSTDKKESKAHFSALDWVPIVQGVPQGCVIRLGDSQEIDLDKRVMRWMTERSSTAPVSDSSPRSLIGRALNELRIWRELKHENIARLDGFILWPNIAFMTPCYVNGHILRFIATHSPSARIRMKDIASAMEYLHGKGIIYGDLRPGTVEVDHNYRALLSNFELSMYEEDAKKGPTMSGHTRYLAPEVPEMGWQKTTQSDVYAYGLLILEIAIGRKAKRESIADDSIAASAADSPALDPDQYPELRVGSSSALWNLVAECTMHWLGRPSMQVMQSRLDCVQDTDWVADWSTDWSTDLLWATGR